MKMSEIKRALLFIAGKLLQERYCRKEFFAKAVEVGR
jgi:hypothetical protein